jgi:hypothetical protein
MTNGTRRVPKPLRETRLDDVSRAAPRRARAAAPAHVQRRRGLAEEPHEGTAMGPRYSSASNPNLPASANVLQIWAKPWLSLRGILNHRPAVAGPASQWRRESNRFAAMVERVKRRVQLSRRAAGWFDRRANEVRRNALPATFELTLVEEPQPGRQAVSRGCPYSSKQSARE